MYLHAHKTESSLAEEEKGCEAGSSRPRSDARLSAAAVVAPSFAELVGHTSRSIPSGAVHAPYVGSGAGSWEEPLVTRSIDVAAAAIGAGPFGDGSSAAGLLDEPVRAAKEAVTQPSTPIDVAARRRSLRAARVAPPCPSQAEWPMMRSTAWFIALDSLLQADSELPPASSEAKAPMTDLQRLVHAMADAMSEAGAEFTFDSDRCKFKGFAAGDAHSPVTFRARIWRGAVEDASKAGFQVELQKRSGDSMAWHDAFHAIVEGLPAEMRPEGFAAAKAAGVGRARAFAPPPVPRDLLASTGLTEGDDLVMKPGDAGALLAMTASSVLSVRREAASTLAMLSKSSASAAAFAVDGTAHALAQLAATGPDARTCDALVASAALAVVANSMAAALCQGAAAAACMAVRAEAKSVAPALLAAVDAARPELADLPSSDC